MCECGGGARCPAATCAVLDASSGTKRGAEGRRGGAGALVCPSAYPPPFPPHSPPLSVNLTLVLPDGTRRPLRGLAGTPLVNLLVDSADALAAHPSPDAFHPPPPLALSPAGRGAPDAVVEVPAEVAALVPPPTGDDARALEELALAVKPSTRLASAVTLDAAFDGATLALSGVRPWATL